MKNNTYGVFLSALNPLFLTVLTLLALGVSYLHYYGYVSALNSVYLYVLSLLAASSIKVAREWEKAVVLRLGKFHALRGPGLFLILPILERVNSYIDQRVRVTDTKAENTLTRDTVPVFVDAIVYWVVWDAKKAAMEVEYFEEAVEYIAQASLRDVIGKHDLAELLQQREEISNVLQKALDKHTNPWGITIQTVGISDINIPMELSHAMSKQAQAERERQARVILGTAETEIAKKFATASQEYKDNPVALQLRGMNMLFEGLKEKGSLIIVPSSALDSMNLGAVGGLAGLASVARDGQAAENAVLEKE